MFITFEGVEGAGKSTQIELLQKYLQNLGQQTVLTREPGGTKLGQRIRQILLEKTEEKFPAVAEIMLYEADRNIHVNNVIKPSLEAGVTVICDRFYDSSLAYQGFARGLDKDLINKLNHLAIEGTEPDITFVLDIDVKKGLQRVEKRGEKDRLEQEKLDFHQKLREGYLQIAKDNPKRVFVINGDQSVEKIHDEIVSCLQKTKNV